MRRGRRPKGPVSKGLLPGRENWWTVLSTLQTKGSLVARGRRVVGHNDMCNMELREMLSLREF